MNTVIAVTGSRDWRDIGTIKTVLNNLIDEFGYNITIRQGCASGTDCIARWFADYLCFDIEDYWPDFSGNTFAEAMKERNLMMLDTIPQPDLVLAFPTKNSRGTWHCVAHANNRGIPVRVYEEYSKI